MTFAVLAVAGCASFPPPCGGEPLPRLKDVLYRTDGEFWFSHAVVKFGYHRTGIAPEEVLAEPHAASFLPLRLSIRLADDCAGGKKIRHSARGASFFRVSGRARLVGDDLLEVDCLCSIERTSYSDPENHFSLYY